MTFVRFLWKIIEIFFSSILIDDDSIMEVILRIQEMTFKGSSKNCFFTAKSAKE